MSSTSRRRSSLSKLSSIEKSHTEARSHRKKKPSLLAALGRRFLSLSYGYFTLAVFLLRFYTMERSWRVLNKKQKQELEDGKLSSILDPQTNGR
jgi:hypothetical protein